ncbi:MAG: Fe-S metabolism associated SufE [Arcobacter sp.]|nr:MAG: Fe-S metabolism associated SufE [Arcobacter sp.]
MSKKVEKRVFKIKEDLDFFDDELEKYQFIIDLGKKLSAFKDEDKITKHIVHGCTSQVWLTCTQKQGVLIFKGTSDAIIVKGLVYILLEIFSNLDAKEINDSEDDILYELGLSEIITPNRQSGVMGMIKKIKEYAKKV